jgi:hypothetical protein
MGSILATATLVDCVPTPTITQQISEQELAFGDYSPERFAWVFQDIRKTVLPIPAKGRQGLWVWEGSIPI